MTADRKPKQPLCDARRERFGHMEFCTYPPGHQEGHFWRAAEPTTLGARTVELDFILILAVGRGELTLSANERIVSVNNAGNYRQVWIERSVS